MEGHPAVEDDGRDWRLRCELRIAEPRPVLGRLVERLRDAEVVDELRASVSDQVVITHDGSRLFAYAADRVAIERARAAIESVLAREGIEARLLLSRFSAELDEWVDPERPAGAEQPARSVPHRPETRTLVATVGRMIREEFEQSMRNWADQLGLRCEIIEHPHLLSSQVAFTVTGPPRKVAEFAAGLGAEERASIRTERVVITSPL
jgi:hypothetical protein